MDYRAFVRVIGCTPSNISNEIARGSIALYNDRVIRYKASAGQKAYENNKSADIDYDYLIKSTFLKHVIKHFTEDGLFMDTVSYALSSMVNLLETRSCAQNVLPLFLALGIITLLKS